jgi:hypothetical protein
MKMLKSPMGVGGVWGVWRVTHSICTLEFTHEQASIGSGNP